MEEEHHVVDPVTLKKLQKCFQWRECYRNGGLRHILYLDGDQLLKLHEVQFSYQHAVCVVRGFDSTLEKDPGWCSATSYPKVTDLREIDMGGEWGIIDWQRHCAIKGGGNKMQKRMLATAIILALCVKHNRALPHWWAKNDYMARLLEHLTKLSRSAERRSRSPRQSWEAEEDEEEEEEQRRSRRARSWEGKAKSEPSSKSSSRSASHSRQTRKRRRSAGKAVASKLNDKAILEKLKQELAEAKMTAEREREEKEAALQAAREALKAEAKARKLKEQAEYEKGLAEQAAQAAALSEENTKTELKSMAADTAKVMMALESLATEAAQQYAAPLRAKAEQTKDFVRTKMEVKTEIP